VAAATGRAPSVNRELRLSFGSVQTIRPWINFPITSELTVSSRPRKIVFPEVCFFSFGWLRFFATPSSRKTSDLIRMPKRLRLIVLVRGIAHNAAR
jgi:hypothetical protein